MLGWPPAAFWAATPADFAEAFDMHLVARGVKPDPAKAEAFAAWRERIESGLAANATLPPPAAAGDGEAVGGR